jgi:hypothetical protein
MTGTDDTARYVATLVDVNRNEPYAVVDADTGNIVHATLGLSSPGWYADPADALAWAQRFNSAQRQEDGEDHSVAALPEEVVNAGRAAGGPFTAQQLDTASWGVAGPDNRNVAGAANPWVLGGLAPDTYATQAEAQRCADWMNGVVYLLTADQSRGAA